MAANNDIYGLAELIQRARSNAMCIILSPLHLPPQDRRTLEAFAGRPSAPMVVSVSDAGLTLVLERPSATPVPGLSPGFLALYRAACTLGVELLAFEQGGHLVEGLPVYR